MGVWGTWSTLVCQIQIKWEHGILDKLECIYHQIVWAPMKMDFLKKQTLSFIYVRYMFMMWLLKGFNLHRYKRTGSLPRTCYLCMLVTALGGCWVLEQPGGSTFQYFPPFRDLLLFCYMNQRGTAVPAQVCFWNWCCWNWNFNSCKLETVPSILSPIFGNWKLDPRLVEWDGGCTTTKGPPRNVTLPTPTVLQCWVSTVASSLVGRNQRNGGK